MASRNATCDAATPSLSSSSGSSPASSRNAAFSGSTTADPSAGTGAAREPERWTLRSRGGARSGRRGGRFGRLDRGGGLITYSAVEDAGTQRWVDRRELVVLVLTHRSAPRPTPRTVNPSTHYDDSAFA